MQIVHVVKGSGLTSEGDSLDERDEIPGAIISIFFDIEEGGATTNAFLESVFDAYENSDAKIKMRQFLSTVNMKDYWGYDGSLTTPPCTEGIKWSVIKQVQPISQAQLDLLKENHFVEPSTTDVNGNSRAVQYLNSRTLYYSGAT